MTKLKILRKEKKLKVQDVAKMLGISRSMVYEIERGTRRPGINTALKISKLFGLSLEEIYSDFVMREKKIKK